MSLPVINGVKGAYLQPTTFGRDESGDYVILTWQGTREEIKQLSAGVHNSGGIYHITDTFAGAATRLEARFPYHVGAVEEPVNDWEYFAGEVEKDILEADLAAINAISQTDKEKIRNAIQAPSQDSSPAITDATAIDVYLLMLNGLRAHPVEVPSLRHTLSVSSQYSVGYARTNVGRILSNATMISNEGVPNTLLITLPDLTSTRTGLSYGWRKKEPTVRVAPWRRIQIQQEWVFGLWPTLLYGAVV